MIQFPRRSVTRFFIPLIDVLILLFCIFLLMPMVKPRTENTALEKLGGELARARAEIVKLQAENKDVPSDLKALLEKLRKDQARLLEQVLAVRVLEIDPISGKLGRRTSEGKVDAVATEDAVQELIKNDREKVAKDRTEKTAEPRELFYLILYPRDPRSPYPTREQRETFDQWFQDVAHGYDIPGLGPGSQGDTP
jgi:hypothetical protein